MWNSTDKIKFRQTKKWKEFREKMIKEVNYTCQLCNTTYVGKRKRLLNIHHLDEENYDDLNPKKFRVLCSTCHRDIVEKLLLRFQTNEFKNFYLYKYWKKLLIKAKVLDFNFFKENKDD